MNTNPYLILEIANAHSGSLDTVMVTLDALADVTGTKRRGVKFQPLHPDRIARPDYAYYKIYQELLFSEAEWKKIIEKASSVIGDVWLDLFDSFGVDILKRNRKLVHGVKFQASVLDNQEMLDGFADVHWAGKPVIINISGYSLEEISRYAGKLSAVIGDARCVLQAGYQRYPSRIEDTPMGKLPILRQAFPKYPLSFADHLPPGEPMAATVPLLAYVMGCTYIEKHVCLSRASSKYDALSSFEPEEIKTFAEQLGAIPRLDWSHFVSDAEKDYLDGTIQVPVMASDKTAGELFAPKDFLYRRSGAVGLRRGEIESLQTKHGMMLNKNLEAGDVVTMNDLRKARVGVVVACRMKSSRLPKKATLPIAGTPSAERCLENCLLFERADTVILATSTLEDDAVLEQHTLGGLVGFWRGDPDDVISRFVGACDEFGLDIVIRVTADCPVVSPEIMRHLFDAHLASGADYTAPDAFAVGTNCEVINTEALRRVIKLLGKADYSEYMTWYFRNNPDVFKVNIVTLPEAMVRPYRLTLDCPEDLEMFEALYGKLKEQGLTTGLSDVFKVLDAHPEIPALNSHIALRYKTDQKLIDKLNRVTRIKLS